LQNTNDYSALKKKATVFALKTTFVPKIKDNRWVYRYAMALPFVYSAFSMTKTMLQKMTKEVSPLDIDRIIEMAWEDRTPFEAIEAQFGLREADVIKLLRAELKPASWRRWRARVQGRSTKHATRSAVDDARFRSAAQRSISGNRLSKR
jgi:uncharacterized protein (TIGR03643 family)